MQFFIELLLWHVVIAAFLFGALYLSRSTRAQRSMNTLDDTHRR